MNLLEKLFILLLLIGFYAPAYSAVDGVELISCGLFNDAEEQDDKKGDKKDDKKGEEEEPDCE